MTRQLMTISIVSAVLSISSAMADENASVSTLYTGDTKTLLVKKQRSADNPLPVARLLRQNTDRPNAEDANGHSTAVTFFINQSVAPSVQSLPSVR
ncbi:hypothetical protein [Alteromonas lipolytica]|uniref:Uncharacterized protein n=1 Tax=Alteromonas lipolytica TaxID=1856405 RepID=A0A1E8FG69_9ALTE|nr:hypothetical protein [Alteromonas lipolytica]OFI34899.1 hypothetical protein BFC17_15125 [Alteromonas lipolytica]GGF54937.1 hypothetical protein GCM10011338_03940 [Alteromonas lipolytica]